MTALLVFQLLKLIGFQKRRPIKEQDALAGLSQDTATG